MTVSRLGDVRPLLSRTQPCWRAVKADEPCGMDQHVAAPVASMGAVFVQASRCHFFLEPTICEVVVRTFGASDTPLACTVTCRTLTDSGHLPQKGALASPLVLFELEALTFAPENLR
jgi:hypothetical protein